MSNGSTIGILVHSEEFEATFEPPVLPAPEYMIIYDDGQHVS